MSHSTSKSRNSFSWFEVFSRPSFSSDLVIHIFRSTGKTTGKHQIAARRIRRHSSRTRSQRARRKSAAGWNRRNGKEDQRSTRAAAASRLADETQGRTASCRDGGGRRIQKVKIRFYSLLWFQNFRQMMEKFAEDDRIEQMNAQKRRMKQLEHKRAVEELIQSRRDQHKVLCHL